MVMDGKQNYHGDVLLCHVNHWEKCRSTIGEGMV